jgi:hypothetical protein
MALTVLAFIPPDDPAQYLSRAADALWTSAGIVGWPVRQHLYSQISRALSAELGEAAFTAAWMDGHRLNMDDAVREALTVAESLTSGGDTNPPAYQPSD